MRNVYIIIANDIHVMGGEEIYIYGKARYLEAKGWEVRVLFPGKNEGECKIEFLNKYLSGGIGGLSLLPYRIDDYQRNYILKQILECIKLHNDDDVIIETHHDIYAFWGELLAEQVGARHYIFCVNEEYRGKIFNYEYNLDFFKFKLDRNEMVASDKSIELLFNGYKGITGSRIEYPTLIMEPNPIQDINNIDIAGIKKLDFNICSIGRTDKYYISHAVRGVKEFAKLHPEKEINFIIVGDEQNIPVSLFSKEKNINVIYLGIVFPIPRKLFDKVDVVIAAAQTAQFVAYENVFTIAANVSDNTTPGVLGCDTLDSWYGGNVEAKTYREVLEDVLVLHKYKIEDIKMPERKPAEYYYDLQWKYLAMADKQKNYYTKSLQANRKKDWVAIFPFWSVKRDSKILIYGAGKVGMDYRNQILETRYCIIAGILDTNADEYDATVMLPEEGLKKIDYDTIVIAVSSKVHANEIKNTISHYTIDKNVVYDIKTVIPN